MLTASFKPPQQQPRRARRPRQLALEFRTWGGKRRGAGRPPQQGRGSRAGVSHLRRPVHRKDWPLHVTVRLLPKAGYLRKRAIYTVLTRAFFAGRARFGFRLIHFSIQHNHIHFLAEAADRRALSRGMQGLAVRMARALNKKLGLPGKVFADRYHSRAVTDPRQTRAALLYVLNNFRRHAVQRGERIPLHWVDAFSSAPHFGGWRDPPRRLEEFAIGPPVTAAPRAWLLDKGWKAKRGLLEVAAVPGDRERAWVS